MSPAGHPHPMWNIPWGGSSMAPMQESSLPREAPLYIEPVEAWRAWEIDLSRPHRGPFLRSITYRIPWPERSAFHAHCLRQVKYDAAKSAMIRHESPDPNHRCGIYAVNDEEYLLSWLAGTYGSGTRVRVGGRVKMWGRVLQYEKGWIAEYAYPSELYLSLLAVPAHDHGKHDPVDVRYAVHELAERYGIELI